MNGVPSAADLLDQWRMLLARCGAHTSQATTIGRGVLAAWNEPHRRYHNTDHLREVLRHVDGLATHATDPDAVRLAAWYHDVIYNGQPDDEHNSARRAETNLTFLGLPAETVNEVTRLICLTRHHNPTRGDCNGETLCDADLAILAAPPDRYAIYAANIRAEYAHLDGDAFRTGRSQVLRSLLDAPTVYRTPNAALHWTRKARTNLGAELDTLNLNEQ